MALNNPAFNNPAFSSDPRAVQTYPGGQQAAGLGQQTQFASASHMGVDALSNSQLEGAYASPSADAVATGRMTVEDTVLKTVALFAVLIAFAAVGWFWTLGGSFSLTSADQQVTIVPWIVGALVGFVLSLVIIFTSRKKIRPALIFAYAAFEGLFVGGISAFFEIQFEGIVLQATLATLAVVGVTLALFASGKIRASKRATKIFMVAMIGYLVFSLINLVLMWTGAVPGAFGMRSQEINIFGISIPLGLIIGILVVIMAAYSLVLDFDGIQQGVRNGAARQYGWLAGFGIMVTVVWLYIEILRIIAIVRGNN